ncbi:hypothetical protein D3C72_1746900 [compost metagenome]
MVGVGGRVLEHVARLDRIGRHQLLLALRVLDHLGLRQHDRDGLLLRGLGGRGRGLRALRGGQAAQPQGHGHAEPQAEANGQPDHRRHE